MPRHIASPALPGQASGPTDHAGRPAPSDPADRARLELALEIGEIGTWSWDLTTGTGDIDERGARIVGLEAGYVADIGEAQRRLIHPDDLARLETDLKSGLAVGDVFDLDYRVVHPDGSIAHVASRARVFRDEDGNPVRLLGTNRDVTAERVHESELRAREERYRTLFEAMDEGFGIIEVVFEADEPVDYRFVEVNPAFERHTGLRDPVGRTARELLPGRELTLLPMYGQVARSGEAIRMRDHVPALGRTVDAFCFRVGDPSERRIAVFVKDVTQQVTADTEREALLERERLARAAAEAFLAVMSHELRTPVTSIYGTAALLSRDPNRPELPDLLRDVQDEAERLRRIIDDLLVLSGVDRGHIPLSPEPVLIQHAVPEVLADARRRFPEVTFADSIPPGLPPVIADTTALRQVLYNLVSNAAKYAGADGPVTISAADVGDVVEVAVLDEGPGVGPEPGALFELFYRSPHTAPRASGTGIGLYVASQLSRAMDASIEAGNRDGGGAAFTVTLPKAFED